VGPGLTDLAVVHDEDAIGAETVARRWATMSEVRPRVSVATACWRRRSVSGSDGARRLVEHEDGGIAREAPREGEQLLLPGGEVAAALADLVLVASGRASMKASAPTALAAARARSRSTRGSPRVRLRSIVPAKM
jgi:hypothetical protein